MLQVQPIAVQESCNNPKQWTKHTKVLEEPVTRQDVETAVRQAFGPSMKLISYHMRTFSEEKLGFLGSHRKLVVTVQQGNSLERDMHTFFVKSVPYDNEEQTIVIEESRAFYKEAGFYEQIVPELLKSIDDSSWLAQCLASKSDVLIFEDLKSKGFELRSKLLDLASMKSAMSSFAKLHAASILTERRLGKPLDEIFDPELLCECLFLKTSKFYDWIVTGIDVLVAIAQKIGLDPTGIPRICHKIFDIISTSKKYVPAVCDLVQLMYINTRRQFRDEHEIDLLRHYHEVLCETLRSKDSGLELPSLSDLLQEYEEFRIVGIVTTSLYSPLNLAEGKLCADLTKDSDGFAKILRGDRIDLVMSIMQDDPLYSDILKEIVVEMVQKSK
ncbi:hypothetical protein QAD02_015768 [Eretmocerus hayati]|uniref:Uncharacterized protein n=1 Tax=Eretmocerus hayati TaxID=131215 RepID=A0ACC2PAE3_9HYME|nr:hypothetical protein QAD02_015768 [Eretmocerus hayati]